MANPHRLTMQVDAFVAQTKKRVDAVWRMSIQDVIDDAQMPTARGGRMRVDTGFLRASGQLSLNGMPSGPARGTRDGRYSYSPEAASVTLNGAEAGVALYWGWTANYAKYREPWDNFLLGAIQRWSQIVERNCRRVWWNSPQGGKQ